MSPEPSALYLAHFGLARLPFGLTPDRALRVDVPTHRRAMAVVRHALEAGSGFVKLTGEVGTGKTLLCRRVLNELGPDFVTAYVLDPMLSPLALRRALSQELGLGPATGLAPHELWGLLRDGLATIHAEGRRAVLVIDEAQTLPDESLESLRLLTNLETREAKLLQVLLVGQPELDDRLDRPALRQLAQRIVFSHTLEPMARDEVDAYVHLRLRQAGRPLGRLFSHRAIAAMYGASRGVPRLVNLLGHKALLAGYGRGDAAITGHHVRRAIADSRQALRWARTSRRTRRWGRLPSRLAPDPGLVP